MGVITTSLVIDFKTDDDTGILKAEIDSREGGYNDGITSFIPGDSPVFLVYKSPDVTIEGITASSGTVSLIASGSHSNSIDDSEYLTFANEREATPKYPISGGFSSKWLGTNGGVVSESEQKVVIPAKAVAVLKVDYTTLFDAYRLSNVPETLNGETSFPVVIFIAGVQE